MNTYQIEWKKLTEELPPPYKNLLFFREDAGVFFGTYNCLSELYSQNQIEYFLGNNTIDNPNVLEELCYYSYEPNGMYLLEFDELPTHWAELPAEPNS